MLVKSEPLASRGFHDWFSLGRKIVPTLRYFGFLNSIALLLRRVLPIQLESFFLCQWDLVGPGLERTDDPDIRPGRYPEDIDWFMARGAQAVFLPVDPTPGTMFLVLECAGQPVAYMWLKRDGFRIGLHRYLRLTVPPHATSGVMQWVVPEHRGKGLGPRLNRQARLECLRQGLTRIVSRVDGLNRNSLRADEKVGYRRICRVTAVRLLGITFIHYAGRWHVGRWSAADPYEIEVPNV